MLASVLIVMYLVLNLSTDCNVLASVLIVMYLLQY